MLSFWFGFLEESDENQMARGKDHEAKGSKATSNRPFDIENLCAPDRVPKKQKPVLHWRPMDHSRPPFTFVESATLPLHGNFTVSLVVLLWYWTNAMLKENDFIFRTLWLLICAL